MRFHRFSMAITCLGALLLSFSPLSLAGSFDNVIYQTGAPNFLPGPFIGTLSVESRGVSFQTRTGKQFFIPRYSIRRYEYQGTSSTAETQGLMLAGPNPIALGAALGISAIGNLLMKPKTKHRYFYSIYFQTPEDSTALQEVKFKVNDETVCKNLMAEFQNYNKPLQEDALEEAPPEQDGNRLQQ